MSNDSLLCQVLIPCERYCDLTRKRISNMSGRSHESASADSQDLPQRCNLECQMIIAPYRHCERPSVAGPDPRETGSVAISCFVPGRCSHLLMSTLDRADPSKLRTCPSRLSTLPFEAQDLRGRLPPTTRVKETEIATSRRSSR
jgi:hypothetical protein